MHNSGEIAPRECEGVSRRHCEEHSDEAIHSFFVRLHGLLRFARNNVLGVVPAKAGNHNHRAWSYAKGVGQRLSKQATRRMGPCFRRDDELQPLAPQRSHNSRALLKANDDTRRVFSSRIKVRVIGGSARWLQFSRSQSRQLTPIGVPSVFSRSIPVA
jgi:hypothetical protein